MNWKIVLDFEGEFCTHFLGVQASRMLCYYLTVVIFNYSNIHPFTSSLKFFTTCFVCLQLIFWNDDASSHIPIAGFQL